MTETLPTSPLAEKALQRLRKIAEGNPISPDSITLYSTEEGTYSFEGVMTLLPVFESNGSRHAGAVRSDRKVCSSRAEMMAEVEQMKTAFETKPTWIPEAIGKLKEQTAEGWGLDTVKIDLPSQSSILAATELCAQCQGRKSLTCTQCNGNGGIVCAHCHGNQREFCPSCAGSGKNPSQPDQPCINCNGQQYTTCRYCNGTGQLVCPTCNGSRGMVCSSCRGAGSFTDEIAITCSARTQFRINTPGLPSGMRRGLDRLGVANLVKGHADVTCIATPADEDGEAPVGAQPGEAVKEKPPKPEVHYSATMPYADLRMNFDGKKTIVGIFGKKSVLLGVPPFLDRALETLRENLQKATKHPSWIGTALDARLMKDALQLQLNSIGDVNALRRIYPLGLSPKVAAEILWNMRLAINQVTLRTRTIAAAGGGGGAAVFFGLLFLTPFHNWLTGSWHPALVGLLDLVLFGAVMGGCWFGLSTATRWALQKRFPGMEIPLTQKTGKTGYSMLGAIAAAFFLFTLFAPTQPLWLQALRSHH